MKFVSILNNKTFPGFYPPNCPANSSEVNVEPVYRLIESNTIKEKEFVPSGIRRRSYFEGDCETLALSVLGSKDDISMAYRFFSSIGQLKKNKVAVGYITRNSGRVLFDRSVNVGNSHINWWTYDGIQPHTFFNKILQIGVDI